MFVSIVFLTFLIKGILSDEGVCEDHVSEDGSSFLPYPGNCTSYVQCRRVGDNVEETVHSCPFGQFWDSDKGTCRPSLLVRCKSDPCRGTRTGFTYAWSGNGCRAHWVCIDGVSVGRCCPQGSAYVESLGCIVGQICDQQCPPIGGNPNRDYRGVQRQPF